MGDANWGQVPWRGAALIACFTRGVTTEEGNRAAVWERVGTKIQP